MSDASPESRNGSLVDRLHELRERFDAAMPATTADVIAEIVNTLRETLDGLVELAEVVSDLRDRG